MTESCATSPLGAVASRVSWPSPWEQSWSVVSSRRMPGNPFTIEGRNGALEPSSGIRPGFHQGTSGRAAADHTAVQSTGTARVEPYR